MGRTGVSCGWCHWRGYRKHPLDRPCPSCGQPVHLTMPLDGIYLLAFLDPVTREHTRFQHAAHYLGWTQNLPFRLHHHRTGNGSKLMAAVSKAGLDFAVVRTWPGASRTRERQLKNQGSLARQCPLCLASSNRHAACGPSSRSVAV